MSNKISKNLISVAKPHVFKVRSSQSVSRFQSQASCISKCLWQIQILHHKGKLWSQSGRSNTKSQRRNGSCVNTEVFRCVELNVFNMFNVSTGWCLITLHGGRGHGCLRWASWWHKIHKAHQWKGLLSVKPVVLAADLNGAAAPPFRNVPYREC